ncbi:unnamed protein product [Thlaspi arvense]|uniref:NYN domain-containing protein n=1 Tax=Thlaspi arvense TaxID=13288 RepID=A0AAU9T775_THLAR|nr:unnamed protein product [Thlaspi arvense]
METTMSNKFSTAETGILWDIEDCPIPNGLCPGSIRKNIKLALENMGYHGEISSITVYYDTNLNPDDFESVGIKLVRTSAIDRFERGSTIFGDIYGWRRSHKTSNLMVILRDYDDYVVDSICSTDSSEVNILLGLAHPEKAPEELLGKASSVWLWTSLLGGGSPIVNDQSGRNSQQRLHDNTSACGESSQSVVTPSPTCVRSGKSLRVANKQTKHWTKRWWLPQVGRNVGRNADAKRKKKTRIKG